MDESSPVEMLLNVFSRKQLLEGFFKLCGRACGDHMVGKSVSPDFGAGARAHAHVRARACAHVHAHARAHARAQKYIKTQCFTRFSH